jgi:hypothetical protein
MLTVRDVAACVNADYGNGGSPRLEGVRSRRLGAKEERAAGVTERSGCICPPLPSTMETPGIRLTMRFSFLSAPSPKPPISLASSRKPAGNGQLKNGAIRIEPLESRIALSISVKAVGTDIFISGDNTANHLAVFEDGAGRLFIYGDVNTAVTGDGTVAGVLPDTNAGGGREFDNGTFKNLYVSLGSADDSVDVAGLHSSEVASLTINTGAATTGDKVVFGTSTFAGNPDADFGASTIAGPVTILTGNGGNTVTLRNLTMRSTSARARATTPSTWPPPPA